MMLDEDDDDHDILPPPSSHTDHGGGGGAAAMPRPAAFLHYASATSIENSNSRLPSGLLDSLTQCPFQDEVMSYLALTDLLILAQVSHTTGHSVRSIFQYLKALLIIRGTRRSPDHAFRYVA